MSVRNPDLSPDIKNNKFGLVGQRVAQNFSVSNRVFLAGDAYEMLLIFTILC